MDPLVSVVVPVYNGEKYLSECLDSLINQLYRNIEVVVVNDGSTDGTKELLDAYVQKDSRIKAIHKENGGVSSARNAALDVIQGEYVHFLDSDDWISADIYKNAVALMKSQNVDMVIMSQYVHKPEESAVLRTTIIPAGKYNKASIIKYSCGVKGKRNIVATFYLGVTNKVFKRELFYKEGNQIYFPIGMKYLEDGFFLVQVLDNVRCGYFDKKGYYHIRTNEESAMGKLDIETLARKMLNGYQALCDKVASLNNLIYSTYIRNAYKRSALYYIREGIAHDAYDLVDEIRGKFSDDEEFQRLCDECIEKAEASKEETV